MDIHHGHCFLTLNFDILDFRIERVFVPTTTKALRAWKNFVLKFRQDFDREFGGEDQYSSLSLILYALATSLSNDAVMARELSAGDTLCLSEPRTTATDGGHPFPFDTSVKRNQRGASNPKYRSPLIDLPNAIRRSQRFHDELNSVLTKSLPFRFSHNTAEYPDQFSRILTAIELSEIKKHPFIIGYTYQFWRDSDRKTAQNQIQSADKQIDREKLIAFTQIYTPEWVVDFIVANSLLPLVEPQLVSLSKLRPLLTPQENSIHAPTLSSISILDPAAGAGNFLLGAFDALFELHTKSGLSADGAVSRIAEQLHGCDIDAVALSVAALALVVRCHQLGVKSPPRFPGLALAIPTKDALLGSLSTDFPAPHPLSRKHSVVITNPPYIGRKLISRDLKALLKAHWPNSHHDLSAAFFERSLSLLQTGGRVGLITQASMLSLPSHEKLRTIILDQYNLKTAIDAGPGVFPLQSGEKVNSAILIVEKPISNECRDTTSSASGSVAHFFNLKDSDEKPELLLQQLDSLRQHQEPAETGAATALNPEMFRQFHGHAFNYNIPPVVAQLLTHALSLESIAEIRQGLATTDNERFVKLIWQVKPEDIGRIWHPYVKGAGGQRYSSPIKYVVNWHNDGADIKAAVAERYPYLKGKTAWVVKNESFYFREGLCFSFVNTRGIAVRKLPPGCIFDVGASAIFSNCNDFLLAYLNSSFMVALANSLNPTINNQVGDLKRFPVVKFDQSIEHRLSRLARECSDIKDEINALIDPSTWYSNKLSISADSSVAATGVRASHEFYNTPYTNTEQAFQEFETLVYRLHSTLEASENEIDEVVLNSIAVVENWSIQEIAEVKRWISSCNVRTDTSLPSGLYGIFSNNLLTAAILRAQTGAHPEVGQYDGTSSSKQYLTRSEVTPVPGLGSESFQSHIEKYFLGFPPEPLRSFHLKGIVC